ncbi:hypothetical protein PIB30_038106 [Stylosanthes scabra]|uniref:Uncharacterized protein n=1 Tax=Stylosanthes scabra TaxID=79078 RepID=A0ABU6RE02_9FABA|nr:hypothetical protein [Stylosanthes scabra]
MGINQGSVWCSTQLGDDLRRWQITGGGGIAGCFHGRRQRRNGGKTKTCLFLLLGSVDARRSVGVWDAPITVSDDSQWDSGQRRR